MITDIEQEIKSLNFEVEGKKLVNDIMDVIRLSFGDITALPTLLARINLNLSACWTKASNKTYFTETIIDEKGQTRCIRLDFIKITEETNGLIGLLRTKFTKGKKYAYINYAEFTPINKSAEKYLSDIMKNDFETIKDKIRKK